MSDRDVMKQAFDALQRARNQVVQLGRLCEVVPDTKKISNAIEALRAALAEPVQEQEPVAWQPVKWGRGCQVCGIGAHGEAVGYVCPRGDCPTKVTCGGAA